MDLSYSFRSLLMQYIGAERTHYFDCPFTTAAYYLSLLMSQGLRVRVGRGDIAVRLTGLE